MGVVCVREIVREIGDTNMQRVGLTNRDMET
jgi:hypothetical protein